ncbi:hypothetical protein IQ02_00253 [Flavobacterium glaciei]|uniref:Uncharacterized protein n=1 Tax=Flavobacterium glaciei TaxID=386300 RepID=A0A562Q5W2_9FLAO|nr:hypothetical protein DFR66_101256 [Flavobacterium glaciei]TWI52114.1 hypothetical protein IQ02_00253 [Flavobacterium glaciei]
MKRLIKRKIKGIKDSLKKEILKYVLPNGFYFSQKGYCPCCDLEVHFQSKNSWLRDYLFAVIVSQFHEKEL